MTLTLPQTNFDPLRDERYAHARAASDVAAWLAFLKAEQKATRTVDAYELTAAHLLELFPENELADFTDGDVMQLLSRYPKASYAMRRACLSSLFGWAKMTRRIPENPLDFIPKPKRVKPKVQDVFTEAEIALLCNVESPDGLLATIAIETGCRNEEMRNLRMGDIALDGKPPVLVVRKAKGGKQRIVPLSLVAQQAIAELELTEGLNREDYLWYTKPGGRGIRDHSKPIGECAMNRWWHGDPRTGRFGVVERANVRYRKLHMTRHTCATRMRERGFDLDEIQEWLGHESISTTSDLYVHTNVYDLAAKLATIEAGLA